MCFGKPKPGRTPCSLPLLYEVPATACPSMKTNGRPPKAENEKRSKRISFAVNETEYAYFQQLAGHGERVVRAESKKPMPTRKRSIAGIIRQLLEGANAPPTETGEAERKALFQIAGMARNLNQLATQANAQGFASVASRSNDLADQLRALISRYDR